VFVEVRPLMLRVWARGAESLTLHEASSPYSQEDATGSCPKGNLIYKPHFNVIFQLSLKFTNGPFLAGLNVKFCTNLLMLLSMLRPPPPR
jgi:hypothetical protein